jgi:DMSO/TMAO reductase YedYZ heme-binding membrane subunit
VSQLWWYTARAAGIVAWSLLVLSVVWGLLLSGRLRPNGASRAWLLDLHRFLGGLAVVFVAVHVAGILLDSYVQFSLVDVLVPFASAWHPLWVAWGIVGLYLLLAVEITSLLRRSLPHRIWKRVHFLSFPLLVVTTIHFLLAGTDADSPIAVVAIAGSALVVGGLVGRRLVEALGPPAVPGAVPAAPRVPVAVAGSAPAAGTAAPAPTAVAGPTAPAWEPAPAVASSQPPTDPYRGESRCAPPAPHEGPHWPPPSPR